MAEKSLPKPVVRRSFWTQFPWWFVAALVLLGAILFAILTDSDFNETYQWIKRGLSLTLILSGISLVPSLLIGLLVGLAGQSRSVFFRNLAFFYLAIAGGIPTIIMIFVLSFVVIPLLSEWLAFNPISIPSETRGVLALTLVYGAIFGDVFRLSLSSLFKYRDQPLRVSLGKVLIPVGITIMALLKDSSLLSVLAVKEITQQARLFAGSTFRFNETFLTVIMLYIALTIPIRLLLQLYEQRLTPVSQ